MKERGWFLAGYILFWYIYFLFFKVVFLLYHSDLSSELDLSTIAGIFFYGSRLDLAFTAYLSAIPFLLVTVSSLIKPGAWLSKSLLVYTTLMLIFVTVLCTTDLELFRIWGFKLDSTPLMYLNTPGEMLVSIGSSPILFLVILNTLVNLFFCFAYTKLLHPLAKSFPPVRYYTLPAYGLATAFLIVPMRGGFQLAPVNHSSAYFSNNLFANQAAINVPWNFFHSLSKSGAEKKNPYLVTENTEAENLLRRLYPAPEESSPVVLKTNRPNIVLIIWESFTAKVAEDLGGLPGITPAFKELSKEGLLFSKMYASGDRSDKGLPSVLSGYPAQPVTSILKTPKKSQQLPHLSQSLQQNGYKTSFYYGGELEFANLKSYLRFGGYEKLVGIGDFEDEQLNSKWGAHDNVVFDKLLSDIEQEKGPKPFFKTIFTLSSHEPFDIPVKPRFPEKDANTLFMSSLYYTDSTIGSFVAEAKKRPWYDNTLFIIIADHGHTYPGGSQVYEAEKFHIPMLWFGGALKAEPAMVESTMSQTDLSATLLQQLQIPAQEYRWSKDILNPASPHFAHYFFKDGVGFVTDSSYLAFDNVGKNLIESSGSTDSLQLFMARGYLQMSYGDYLNK